MRAFRIGARGIVHDALARFAGFGVEVLTSGPLPDFPWGYQQPPMTLDYGGLGDEPHCCRREPGVIVLQGGFVVFNILVQARCGTKYRTRSGFRPFFSGEVQVYHDDVPTPDLNIWRPLNGAAAAICGLAQNPWLGSVAFQTGLPNCEKIAEAYLYRGHIIVNWADNPRHHVAYIRTDSAPAFYWNLTEERC